MKILAIHAHPDDIEFLAAGTLALLKEQGHEIVMATVANGDKGTPDKRCEEIAVIRREEAKRSAALLGAEYHCLEFPDFEIFDDDRSRRAVTEFLRRVNPDIVLTANPEDYMADHINTSVLVRNAAFVGGLRNYFTGLAPVMDHIPALYYMDPLEGIDTLGYRRQPEFCVDISSAIALKEQMLAAHASQREWLRKHHGVDQYLISMKEWAAERGAEFGFAYGEGFVQHKGHAYPRENVLARLLPMEKIRTTKM